jgi:phosphoribosylformylglycinamidine cyclo-ligase
MTPVFEWLQKTGNVKDEEMHRTFNCGVGMVLIVDASSRQSCVAKLRELGETAWVIGEVIDKESDDSVILI